jgi:hypothetical protein
LYPARFRLFCKFLENLLILDFLLGFLLSLSVESMANFNKSTEHGRGFEVLEASSTQGKERGKR